MTLGEKIKKERGKLKISQLKLGELLSVTQQAVGKWEKDLAEPDASNLKKLSELFNVSIDYLLESNYAESATKPVALSEDEKILIEYYRRLVPKNKIMLINLMHNIFDETKDLPVEQVSVLISAVN